MIRRVARSPRTLTSTLEAQIPARVRMLGEDVHARHFVDLQDGNTEYVLASVEDGAEQYEVALWLMGRDLTWRCRCDEFAGSLAPCKHLWGAVLEAQLGGFLTSVLTRDEIHLVPEDPFDDERRQHLDEIRDAQRQQLQARGRSWEKVLAAVEAGERGGEPASYERFAWTAQRKLLYLLDVEKSARDGRLVVELARQERKANGDFGKPRVSSLAPAEIETLPDPLDRRILSILRGCRRPEDEARSAERGGRLLAGPFRPPPEMIEVLLPLFLESGRCHLLEEEGAVEVERPLVASEGPPLSLRLVVTETEDGGLRLDGRLDRDGTELDVEAPALVAGAGYVVFPDGVERLSEVRSERWLDVLRRAGPVDVAADKRNSFLERLFSTADLPKVDLPAELALADRMGEPQPWLAFRPMLTRAKGTEPVGADLSFEYDGWRIESREPVERSFDATRGVVLRRNRPREAELRRRLEELGFRHEWGFARGEPVLVARQAEVPEIVRALVSEGWKVEAQGRRYRAAGDVRIRVSSGIDWFDVQGNVWFDEAQVSLPAVLKALRRGENTVQLGDGTVGMLPKEWMRRFGLLSSLGHTKSEAIRFKSSQAGLLDLLLEGEAAVDADETFAAARQRLASFSGVSAVEPGERFTGELRPYQREGLGWLLFLREFGFGGCLADDMGLGKTVQVLALLDRVREQGADKPVLLVVPRSLLFNWRRETQRFTPRLTMLEHTGPARARSAAELAGADFVMTTYGTLVRDVPWLREIEFDTVVLDEAQAIKNARTQTAKAARLLQSKNRLALSGTPVENHLGELWSLFEFLNPGMLGRMSLFLGTGAQLRDPDPETKELLTRAIRPFFLRRTKEQVARDLPERTEQTVVCELNDEERANYDELVEHYRASLLQQVDDEGIDGARMHVLEALLRLRQAACHRGLLDSRRAGAPGAKVDTLLERLREVVDEGHKALVFSQFTTFLDIVRKRLDADGLTYEYLDGRTRHREEHVSRFQDDEKCGVFLISLKAGGFGLNLTAADYVFLLDPWWNPAVEAQAIDRTHRIGQTRPVFAYRLIAKDTVEEKVLELQERKRDLAGAIVRADAGPLSGLTREELADLLA